jgi:hypothetical protein
MVTERNPEFAKYVALVHENHAKYDDLYHKYMAEHPEEAGSVEPIEIGSLYGKDQPQQKPSEESDKEDMRRVSPERLALYKEGEVLKSTIDKYEGDIAIAKYALAIAYNTFSKKKINLKELSKRCRVSATKKGKEGEDIPQWGLTEDELHLSQDIADKMIVGSKANESLWRREHPQKEKQILNPSRDNGRVTVDTNIQANTLTQHTDICIDAIASVYNVPKKQVFVRNGVLSNIFYDEKTNVKIADISRDGVRSILDRCCNFVTYEETETHELIEKKARPQKDVCENILATTGIHDRLPPLIGITESPYITMDGKVVTAPGYNEETALYFVPSLDYTEISVPESPTSNDVKLAVDHIDYLFSEFEFENEPSRDNVFAAVLTSVLRPTINGCTPMYLVDKPQMGTGGSLVCEILTRISTGKALEPSNAPKANDVEEWEKIIVSILAAGTPVVCFDNIESNFQSASLASVLTARSKKCRILGTTNHTTFAVNVNWIGNGINLNIGGDLPRRIYLSRIVTSSARPQQRSGFKIPKIKEYVSEHRYEYIRDILTIAKAYHNAGCPKPVFTDELLRTMEIPAMGSFEEWRDYIGGMMVYIGKIHFLGNMEDVLQDSEAQNSEGEELLENIYKNLGSAEFTAKQIVSASTTGQVPLFIYDEFLPTYIASDTTGGRSKKLGRFFVRIKGRVFASGYKLVYMRESRHTQHWSVAYIEQTAQQNLDAS